jgi:parallel beta-helix repeat protein
MVFVDGRFLQSAGWEGEVDSNSYYIDYDAGLVYIGVDPTERLVEITAFDVALLRTTRECHGKKSDKKGYTIRGLTFTQYAYRALEIEGTEPNGVSDESQHGKEVVGSTLENCTISFCSRVAGYFRGDHLTIRHSRVTDTSTEGVYIIASSDVLLEGNIFTRNNIENITGYYPAAVKIFNQSHRVTCRDNLVIDLPNSNGIWYDVGNVDGVFVNNWVQDVGHNDGKVPMDQLWPSDNGFFFEISKGVVCAGNVFVNCDHGIMVLNSSNAQIYQNTFVNSMACVGRTGRTAAGDHFGWHPSTGPDVDKREGHIFVNNLLTGDRSFCRPLLFVWQPASLCEKLTKPQLTQLDHNVYVRAIEKTPYPLITWSPAPNKSCQAGFDSLESLRRMYAGFSADGRVFMKYDGPLFRSTELGDYRILVDFPGSVSGLQLPTSIRKVIGRPLPDGGYVGAYPPVP